jgi:hypothetical protein
MADKNNKPVVNFAVLQSVEDCVEKSGKFRTKCAFLTIPGRDSGGASAVYIPYCDKQRFDFGHPLNEYRGQGVFKPPETGKRWQMTDFILFRERFHDIHCHQPCQGYRNKLWSRVPMARKWTGKEIVIAVVARGRLFGECPSRVVNTRGEAATALGQAAIGAAVLKTECAVN